MSAGTSQRSLGETKLEGVCIIGCGLIQDYRLLCKLGEGTFSVVLKVKSKKDGLSYAMKRFRKPFNSADEVETLREIQALKRLNPHPHIVELKDVIFEPKHGILSLTFELMECNLYELISRKHSIVTEDKAKVYFYQICRALEYVHGKGIFHRDIKPENILYKDGVVKIADFGSCRGIHSKQPFTEYIATRWYRSPECLLCDGMYNFKMDVWGAGCVLYEIVSRNPLFPGSDELDQLHKIHAVLGTPSQRVLRHMLGSRVNQMKFNFPPKEGTGIRSLIPQASKECLELIMGMLAYNPDERITCKDALKYDFFKDIDPSLVESTKAPSRKASPKKKPSEAAPVPAQEPNSHQKPAQSYLKMVDVENKPVVKQKQSSIQESKEPPAESTKPSEGQHAKVLLPPIVPSATQTSEPSSLVQGKPAVAPSNPSKPTESESSNNGKSMSIQESVVKPIQESVKSNHPQEPVKSNHPQEPVKSTHPQEPVKSTHPQEPVKSNHPTDITKPSHPTDITKPSHPQESKFEQVSKPSHMQESVKSTQKDPTKHHIKDLKEVPHRDRHEQHSHSILNPKTHAIIVKRLSEVSQQQEREGPVHASSLHPHHNSHSDIKETAHIPMVSSIVKTLHAEHGDPHRRMVSSPQAQEIPEHASKPTDTTKLPHISRDASHPSKHPSHFTNPTTLRQQIKEKLAAASDSTEEYRINAGAARRRRKRYGSPNAGQAAYHGGAQGASAFVSTLRKPGEAAGFGVWSDNLGIVGKQAHVMLGNSQFSSFNTQSLYKKPQHPSLKFPVLQSSFDTFNGKADKIKELYKLPSLTDRLKNTSLQTKPSQKGQSTLPSIKNRPPMR